MLIYFWTETTPQKALCKAWRTITLNFLGAEMMKIPLLLMSLA